MNVGIIGIGLIGGSMGRSLVKNTSHTVYATDIQEDAIIKGGLLNAYHHTLDEDSYNIIDILIVAVNPRGFLSVLLPILPHLKKQAIIMDIGGNKEQVVQDMKSVSKEYPHLQFVASHPMAGREFWGINHSMPTLFERSTALIIPVYAEITSLVSVKKLLLEMGFMTVITTTSKKHDQMIAYTSQLPHIISSSYIKNEIAPSHNGFSAGSFRDMSRVAKLNASMWTELMIDNKEYLLDALQTFISHLEEYKAAIESGNEDKLFQLLEEGNDIKNSVEKATREWRKNL